MKPRLLDLPHGYQTVIDEADWPEVQKLGALYRGNNGFVYYSQWFDGASHPRTLHSFLVRDEWQKGDHTDHIDGDKLNNRRENLRVVTPQINQVNRKSVNKNNTSGVRGVSKAYGKWRAQITVNRRNLHLGLFKTKDEALAARKRAELRYYGELCPSHDS